MCKLERASGSTWQKAVPLLCHQLLSFLLWCQESDSKLDVNSEVSVHIPAFNSGCYKYFW